MECVLFKGRRLFNNFELAFTSMVGVKEITFSSKHAVILFFVVFVKDAKSNSLLLKL